MRRRRKRRSWLRRLVSGLLLVGGTTTGFDAVTDTVVNERHDLPAIFAPVQKAPDPRPYDGLSSLLKSLASVAALLGAIAVSSPARSEGQVPPPTTVVQSQDESRASMRTTLFRFPIRSEALGHDASLSEFIGHLNALEGKFARFIELHLRTDPACDVAIRHIRFDLHAVRSESRPPYVQGVILTRTRMHTRDYTQVVETIDTLFHLKHHHASELARNNDGLSRFRAVEQAIDSEWDTIARSFRAHHGAQG